MSSEITISLFEQKNSGVFCDVKVSLGGSFMMGHACVLSAQSSYFSQLLQSSLVNGLSWQDHWCPKRPVVVDLESSLTDSQSKCVLCVSSIIDFMYTKKLVVDKDHSEHFSNIVHFLGVSGLFSFVSIHNNPPPVNSLDISRNNSQVDKNEVDLELEIDKKSLISNNRTGVTSNSEKQIFASKNCSQPELECIDTLETSNYLNISKNCKVENEKKVVIEDFITKRVSEEVKTATKDHKHDTKSETLDTEKCEFPCCNASEDPPTPFGKQHKRKMFCQICSHSEISVQKVIEHIENSNHFGTMCPVCKIESKTLKFMQDHLKEHRDPKPYLCPVCSKRNVFWDYHKLHLKTHCRKKQFLCEICKKRFTRYENLIEHIKSHPNNYFCNICNKPMLSSDALKSHILDHEENIKRKIEEVQKSVNKTNSVINAKRDTSTGKHFVCKICDIGFTKKKNLHRHSQLTHLSALNYNCSLCAYKTKRTDQLKHHMIKRHNSSLNDIKEITQTGINKKCETSEEDLTKIVGLMIPVKLVSTTSTPTNLDAFAVKTVSKDELQKNKRNKKPKLELDLNQTSSSGTALRVDRSACFHPPLSKNDQFISFEFSNPVSTNNVLTSVSSAIANCTREEDMSFSVSENNEQYVLESVENNVGLLVESSESNLPSQIALDNENSSKSSIAYKTKSSEEISTLNLHYNIVENVNYDPEAVKSDGNVLLHEATGEFLYNVQVLDTSYSATSSETTDPSSIHGLILSSNSNGISIYDFEKDFDQFQSNPQTPLANVVELEDTDNIFPWGCLDNSFYSTWVLNEATGELNMVSFSVQTLKQSDELQLDENTGTFLSKDDDETALFLNEGTGDLSVIYFNPKHSLPEQKNQENFEVFDNVSEHSNDDEDFLTGEFFQATANFMSHEENEVFLNELTGEFNTANFESEQNILFENHMADPESYLNEETGEISWNILDKNLESGLFTGSNSFQFGFDDSLNCDDLDPMPDEVNDGGSHFHLDNERLDNWHSVEDACDTMLNECTGELVKKN